MGTLKVNGDISATGTLSASSFLGNASSATKLATTRTISLSGDASGSASFDGSANITIPVTVADDSHNHTSYYSSISLMGDVTGSSAAAGNAVTTTIGNVGLIDGFQTSFRTSIKGNPNAGAFLRIIRSESAISGYTSAYGSGLAWGRSDTHAYIYMNYSSAQVFVGGGSSDKLNWVKQLSFSDHTHNYLPLSGGTLSGNLCFSVGLSQNTSPTVVATWVSNDSANGFAWASPSNLNVGNADTVDGYHASSFFPASGGAFTSDVSTTSTYSNAPIRFNSSPRFPTNATYYTPWISGIRFHESIGYGITTVLGQYGGSDYTNSGFYIGMSWDGNNSDTYFTFNRQGVFYTPRLKTSNYGSSVPGTSNRNVGEVYFVI